jgi:transcription elongation factor
MIKNGDYMVIMASGTEEDIGSVVRVVRDQETIGGPIRLQPKKGFTGRTYGPTKLRPATDAEILKYKLTGGRK